MRSKQSYFCLHYYCLQIDFLHTLLSIAYNLPRENEGHLTSKNEGWLELDFFGKVFQVNTVYADIPLFI